MRDITKFFNSPLMLFLLLLTIVGASSTSTKAVRTQRGFYFTKEFHNGAQTLSACADGHHMASLWEIFDTSNLKYNTALGVTTDDSGFGPPTFVDAGWIRTGGSSEGQIGQVGVDNCFAWSSESPNHFGTAVRPARGWSLTPSNTGPWDITLRSCSDEFQVWCVQD